MMRTAGLLAAATLAPLVAAAADAQTSAPGEKHGDWEKRCETPPGAASPQCYVVQTVAAADRPNVVLVVLALTTADRKARLIRIITPLGTLLPQGVRLRVGDQDFGAAPFVRCLPNGCVAEAAIDDRLLAALKSSPTASVSVFQTPEEGIAVDLPLNGFKEAFEAMP